MDKLFLVDQLASQLRELGRGANAASADAAEEARNGATGKERVADTRVAIENSNLASGQRKRAQRAYQELATLESFRPGALGRGAVAAVGALVEIEDEDSGQGRTFFLAPVGAGVTLTGPDGDGFLTVVTPSSPIGKAVLGRRVGDIIDVTVQGEPREWRIVYLE